MINDKRNENGKQTENGKKEPKPQTRLVVQNQILNDLEASYSKCIVESKIYQNNADFESQKTNELESHQ